MNRRTTLRVKNAVRFSKNYIFNPKFIVRNTLGVLSIGAVVTATAFTVKSFNNQTEVASADTVVETGVTTEATTEVVVANETEEYVINLDGVTLMREDSIDMAKAEIKKESEIQVAANQTVRLSTSNTDMKDKFIVKADGINVRKSASEDADILKQIPMGTFGDILEKSDKWIKVSVDGVTGYVSADFIYMDDDATAVAKEALAPVATTNTELKVRSAAAEDGEVVYIAESGDKLAVDSSFKNDKWTKVILNDKEGYVASEYVTVESNVNVDNAKSAFARVIASRTKSDELIAKANNETTTKNVANAQATATTNNTTEAQVAVAAESTTAAQENVAQAASAETQQTESVAASSDDVTLLACIVFAEANSETYEGKLAVASCVVNRLKTGRWGNTLADVIYAPGQFTAVDNHWFREAVAANGGNDECRRAAAAALSGQDNIGGRLSYRPSWYISDPSTLGDYITVGTQYFF